MAVAVVPEAVAEGCGQTERDATAPMALLGGTGAVGGHLEQAGAAVELAAPVMELAVQHAALQPVPLPDGVVGVL